MDKNKSIDGLSPRRPKTASSSVHRKPSTTTRRAATKTAAKSPAQPKPLHKSTSSINGIKPATKKPTTKSTNTAKPAKPSSSPRPKSAKSAKSAKPANSTNPTQITTPVAPSQPVTTPAPEADTPTPSPRSSAEDFLKPVQAFDFDEQSGELKASTTPTSKGKKMKKDKKPVSKKRKIITRIIIAIVVLLIAAVIGLIIWGNDILAKITGGQGNVFDLIFSEETYEPLKTDENGRTNILAFGTSGYDMEGSEGEGTHDGAQLTDSIMVISLDQKTGDLAMLSLPRDLKVSSTCTATGKINEIFWCNNTEGNNEQAGAEALMNEVGDILDIDFQYYAHINWASLIQIVNILDGITITLDEDVEDYYYTGAVFRAGVPYTVNGDQALGLARARHGTASGDFSRGASQQKILIGIKDKVFEKSLSMTDLINLANTLGDNLRTNFSVTELKSLAHLTSDFDFDAMRQVSLVEPENYMTTGTINGISYVLPIGGPGNYSRIHSYIAKMFSSDPRSYENSSILVLNGTETPGLASTEENSLEDDGYVNIYVDDAPAGNYSEQYTLYALTDTAPGTKKLLEEKYSTTAKSPDELPSSISRDYDFVLILGNSKDNKDSN